MATRRQMDLLTAVEQIVEKHRGQGLAPSSIGRLLYLLSMWPKRWISLENRV